MGLTYTLIATLLVALVGVGAAALISQHWFEQQINRLISFAVGMLLASSVLHMLPEALAQTGNSHAIFGVVLGGLLLFFVMEQLSIFRHNHHHEHDGHDHPHGYDREQAGNSGYLILLGDGVHNFTDGLVIAAAFYANTTLGVVTTAAIIMHEIAQEIGDFIVLRNAGFSKRRAILLNFASSLPIVAGGLLGWWLLAEFAKLIPYALAFSAASFLYVALADLTPQLQQKHTTRSLLSAVAQIAVGVGLVVLLSWIAHRVAPHHHPNDGHSHSHPAHQYLQQSPNQQGASSIGQVRQFDPKKPEGTSQ